MRSRLALLASLLALALSVPLSAEPPAPDPGVASDGAAIYLQRCAPCHGPEGRGVAAQVPPLAGSDYLKADIRRAIGHVLKGLQGPVTVNGTRYDSAMPSHGFLSDDEVAAVLTHVVSRLNAHSEAITPSMVAAVRSENAGQPEVAACPCGGKGCGAMGARARGACGLGAGGCAMMGGAGAQHRCGLGR